MQWNSRPAVEVLNVLMMYPLAVKDYISNFSGVVADICLKFVNSYALNIFEQTNLACLLKIAVKNGHLHN